MRYRTLRIMLLQNALEFLDRPFQHDHTALRETGHGSVRRRYFLNRRFLIGRFGDERPCVLDYLLELPIGVVKPLHLLLKTTYRNLESAANEIAGENVCLLTIKTAIGGHEY
jgi:hypothetical protein